MPFHPSAAPSYRYGCTFDIGDFAATHVVKNMFVITCCMWTWPKEDTNTSIQFMICMYYIYIHFYVYDIYIYVSICFRVCYSYIISFAFCRSNMMKHLEHQLQSFCCKFTSCQHISTLGQTLYAIVQGFGSLRSVTWLRKIKVVHLWNHHPK